MATKLAQRTAEKTGVKQGNGNMVKIVTGVVLSLAIVGGLGAAALNGRSDVAGVSQASAPGMVQPAVSASRNVQTIVTGPDGQKVIQNSFDGSLLNLDGSVYIPMMTQEFTAAAAAPAASFGPIPAQKAYPESRTVFVAPDGQWVFQDQNGDIYNLDGSLYLSNRKAEFTAAVATPAATFGPIPARKSYPNSWTSVVAPDGQRVFQDQYGNLYDSNGGTYFPMPAEEKTGIASTSVVKSAVVQMVKPAETIVVAPDGHIIIQNAYDGGMVNPDGSPIQ